MLQRLDIQIALQTNTPFIVWGSPGVGKTSFVNAMGKSLGLHVETVIASLHEPQDFAGWPILGDNDALNFAPPAWAKRLEKEGKGILFLDELTTAPPAVQAVLLRVLLDRYVGDLKLPDDVLIIAAANPPSQAAAGWSLSAPLANRCVHLEWEFDEDEWMRGMMSDWPAPEVLQKRDEDDWTKYRQKALSFVAAFRERKPGHINAMPDEESKRGGAWPSPRTWDMAVTLMSACMSIYNENAIETGNEVAKKLVAGCVGKPLANEFFTYVQNLDLPDPKELLKRPDSLDIRNQRSDKAYAILYSITGYLQALNRTNGQAAEYRNKYFAAWMVMDEALNQERKDVVVPAARILLQTETMPVGLEASDLPDTIFRLEGITNLAHGDK